MKTTAETTQPASLPAAGRWERDTLVGFLRDQRLTLEMKCAGLDAEAIARRSVEPSNLSCPGWCGIWPESNRPGSAG